MAASASTAPASPAQLSVLESALAAFGARYASLKALNPAKLSPAQVAARNELLASGARLDATIRALTGIRDSVTQTVSGWWNSAKGLLDTARKSVGLGALPLVLAGAAALALVAAISAWLGSSAWATLKTAGITSSAHEGAVKAYDAVLSAGGTQEDAITAAERYAAALGPPQVVGAASWQTWVERGALAAVALLLVRAVVAPRPSQQPYPPSKA